MKEVEFSVLARDCLNGRNPGEEALHRAFGVYKTERNAAAATTNWGFTTQDP